MSRTFEMSDLCAVCGAEYGVHEGTKCPGAKTRFRPAGSAESPSRNTRLLLLAERARLLREALDENHSGNLELLVLQLSEEVVQVTDLLRDTIGELLLGAGEDRP